MVALKRKFAVVILDVLLINCIIFLTFFIRYNFDIPQDYLNNVLKISISTTCIYILTFMLAGLYNSLWKFTSIDELIAIIIACAASTVIIAIYNNIIHIPLRLGEYILLLILSIFIIGGSRISYRILRRLRHYNCLRSYNNYKNVMVIGAGEAGAMVIKELISHPEIGLKPVVIIDDDATKHYNKIMGVYIYGNRDKIPGAVEKYNIEEIIIAIPSEAKAQVKEILDICKETKCKLKTLPGIYEIIDERVSIKDIRDVQIDDLLGRDPIKVDLESICGYLSNNTVLVTGGGGSIGSELCRQIARYKPKKLIILDIYENNAYDLQQELMRIYPELNQLVLIASVRDKGRIDDIFNNYKPDVVFHAAAHKHVPLMEVNPMEAIKNNVFGTLNVAEAAHQHGTKRFVLISTDKAVNPTNIMGASKRIAEMIIQGISAKSETEYVAVRFGNVLGSNGSVIPLFKKQIAEGGPVTVTHPDINRFFMTIPEAVELVLQAGAMAKGGEIFILDMGQPVKITDLAKDLIKLSGLEPDIDIKIEYTGLRPGEKLYEELMLEEEDLSGTKHQKIFIAQPMSIDYDSLLMELGKFRFLSGNSIDIVKFVEKLVPTYHNPNKDDSEQVAAASDSIN